MLLKISIKIQPLLLIRDSWLIRDNDDVIFLVSTCISLLMFRVRGNLISKLKNKCYIYIDKAAF